MKARVETEGTNVINLFLEAENGTEEQELYGFFSDSAQEDFANRDKRGGWMFVKHVDDKLQQKRISSGRIVLGRHCSS
jgi:hypothetical protein